eukprot:4348063-Prymnesium_polylepis.1
MAVDLKRWTWVLTDDVRVVVGGKRETTPATGRALAAARSQTARANGCGPARRRGLKQLAIWK